MDNMVIDTVYTGVFYEHATYAAGGSNHNDAYLLNL